MTAAPYRAKKPQDDYTSYKALEVDRTYKLYHGTEEDCNSKDLHGSHDPCEPWPHHTSEKYKQDDLPATFQMPRPEWFAHGNQQQLLHSPDEST